jgi:DNA-binding MarR family transcriptional regulator
LTGQVPVKAAKGTLSSVEGGAWGGFLRVHATIVRKLDAELREVHGLALSSYEVLLHLSWAPGHRMRMGELAESILLTLGGVTRLIGRLEGEGLVRREPCPEDRRGAYAILTRAGAERLYEANSTHLAGVHKLFLEHFAEEELKTMAGYWHRVLSGVQA